MLRVAASVVLSILVACASAVPRWNELAHYTFAHYVQDFDKPYARLSPEYARRQEIFEGKLQLIHQFNINPLNRYKRGVNHLTDYTDAEHQQMMGKKFGGYRQPSQIDYVPRNETAPNAVDYRFRFPPVLSAVKDQGHCGSCWAFAASAAVESHYAIATGKLFLMSPQQLTSCAENPHHCGGAGGCEGATEDIAFQYLVNASGATEEYQYPYTSYYGASGTCEFNRTKMRVVANLTGFYKLPSNEDAPLAEALFLHGPISVSVDATYWHLYESGVFDGCNYSTNITINHAVQLVGLGTDETGTPYWIIRNSWNAGFGENGYIRLLRSQECGWNTPNADGSGCDNDPVAVWTCGMCGVLYDNSFPKLGAAAGPLPAVLVFAETSVSATTTFSAAAFGSVTGLAAVASVVALAAIAVNFCKKPSSSYDELPLVSRT
jgi:cathepsin L